MVAAGSAGHHYAADLRPCEPGLGPPGWSTHPLQRGAGAHPLAAAASGPQRGRAAGWAPVHAPGCCCNSRGLGSRVPGTGGLRGEYQSANVTCLILSLTIRALECSIKKQKGCGETSSDSVLTTSLGAA